MASQFERRCVPFHLPAIDLPANFFRLTPILLLALLAIHSQKMTCADDFEPVASLLTIRCLECHSGSEPSGNLDLTLRAKAMQGGDSGKCIEPGSPESSLLLQRVHSGEMPPKKGDKSQRLADAEITILREWIKSGAKWPEDRALDQFAVSSPKRAGRDWWSLQPARRTSPPSVQTAHDALTPIDAFILKPLEERKWHFAPLADARTMARRVYTDLLGLPPSYDDREEFAREQGVDAYERLIDRLLASPAYGERTARQWLDVARYAESCGYERDQMKPFIWKYRDWVIAAINSDLPYNRFVEQQLAGDEVPYRSETSLVATGFLRLGTWNDEPNDPQEYKYDRLEDLIHATSTAFLGLTIKCARCHDHKFDPVRQQDYYRLGTAFWAGYVEPGAGDVLGGPDPKVLGGDIHGWTDRSATPPELHLLKKGDPKRPAHVVAPAHMSFITHHQPDYPPPAADTKTSQRRLQVAKWITDPANPLTARVWVNRLWQHRFGNGIVRSPDNFGFTGDPPTHPELLDWLATELISRDWSTKRLQRLMLLSRGYRQSSLHPEAESYADEDYANRWLWRAERRRLDSDLLRDALLAAAGELDLGKRGGPSFAPTISGEALEGLSMKSNAWKASPPAEQRRRSIYMLAKRHLLSPLATTFDFPDTTLPCGRRDVTTVAPQALALLNNEFVHQQSQALAEQVIRASDEPRARIEAAWQAVLARKPTGQEIATAMELLDLQRRRFETAPREAEKSPDLTPELLRGAVLHLAADRGITTDDSGRVVRWQNQSASKTEPEKNSNQSPPSPRHDAQQEQAAHRPLKVADAGNGKPAVRFDGQARYLHIDGQVLQSQQFSIIAVAVDAGGNAHREIFSNWNGSQGNSTNSVFLGLTGPNHVRLSDDFVGGEVQEGTRPFLLSAISRDNEAVIYQNGESLIRRASPLAPRNLSTAYVIGQQGNIQGEYWNGDIFELLVYDRGLNDQEWRKVLGYFAAKYSLSTASAAKSLSPELLAWASLCHVLLNTNEFIYVD